MRKFVLGFPAESDTNQAAQPMKMTKGLKFLVGLCYMYLCSENKGVDHLPGYRAADLHLCFGIN